MPGLLADLQYLHACELCDTVTAQLLCSVCGTKVDGNCERQLGIPIALPNIVVSIISNIPRATCL